MDILKAREELLLGKTIYDMNLKVAFYARVSTDKDEQLNSLDNQANYFVDYIKSINNWSYVKGYIDEGISGTAIKRREQFIEMLRDAKKGKIDLVLTKEVSRFARNTIDSIMYTQELLSLGVIVLFMSDNINTIYPDSEFRLTLMASIAQDEVRKLSERVKFGIKRSIKDGKLSGSALCGYIKMNGKLIINEREATIVRKLFDFYIMGYGFRKIGMILARQGHFTKRGKIFSDVTLKKMLTNPRYKGYFTANLSEIENYKTHKKRRKPKEEWIVYKDDKGIVPAIVSEEIWNRANQMYEQRSRSQTKNVLNKEMYLENRRYTSKIYCKEHNCSFIRCASGKRKDNPVWQCNRYLREGVKACRSPILREDILNRIFSNVIQNKFFDKDKLLEDIIIDYSKIIKKIDYNSDTKNIKVKIREQEEQRERLLDIYLRQMINDDCFLKKKEKIDLKLLKLNKELEEKNCRSYVNDYQILINNIRNYTCLFLDIKRNCFVFFDLFVDRVFVSKIGDDRKQIILEIIYTCEGDNETLNVDLNNY